MNKDCKDMQHAKGNLFKINLCQGCYDELKAEYGESLGYTCPTEITIVSKKNCDYLEMPDGRLQFEYKKGDKIMTQEKFTKAKQCLIDNGIDKDDAEIVLQALCYILVDEETEDYFEEE